MAEWFIAAVFKTVGAILDRGSRGFESYRLRTNSGPTEAGNFLRDAGIIGDVDADKEVTRMPWYPLWYLGSPPGYHLLLLEE